MTRTFHFHPLRNGLVGGLCVVMGAFFFGFPIYGIFVPGFYKGFSALKTAGVLLLGFLFVLMCAWMAVRIYRCGVQVSGQKLTIRNEFRTHTVDAADIRAINLQQKDTPNGLYWVPRVELTSGKSIWIDDFDCGVARRPPKPQRVAAVEEVRALLGLGDADLTAETR